MARLIDADKLGLTDFEIVMCDGDHKEALRMLLDKIHNAPTVDAEPVVRCMDCKWFNHIIERISPGTVIERRYEYWECELGYSADDEWFCADGERRNDAE